jgi:diguanylate cyclase (GGDEF)-like protein
MTENHLRVLLVDDDEEEFFLLKELLSQSTQPTGIPTVQLEWVATYEAALEAFKESAYDAYLIDYRLGDYSGIDLIRAAKENGCPAPLILLTGKGNYTVDLAAMQEGAADYLVKGQINAPLLERSIRYAIERADRTLEMQRRTEELEALLAATTALLTTLDLDEMLEKILDAARSAIPAAEKEGLELVATGAQEPRGFLAIVMNEKQPLLVIDCCDETNRILVEPLPDWQEVRSLLVAPLLLGEVCLGALALGAYSPSVFSERDLQILVGFAATATAALQNARLYEEIQRLSITDTLTELYNRRGLYALSRHEIKQARRHQRFISLILFDLDHFKEINDRYGHPVGDEVLQEIARRVKVSIRSIDIFARYGGEEFAILLPECDLAYARQIAERLRRTVARHPIKTKGGPVSMTLSLGITGSPNGAAELPDMIAVADQALYQAKRNGRNRTEILA